MSTTNSETDVAASDAEPEASTSNSESHTTSAPHVLPKAKLSALARFKSFTTSGFKWNDTKLPSFPPSSWDLSLLPNSGTGASDWNYNVEQWKVELEKWKEKLKYTTPKTNEGNRVGDNGSIADDQNGSAEAGRGESATQGSESMNADDAPDSRTLAMRIKALIDEKFYLGSKSTTRGNSSSAPATPLQTSEDGNGNSSRGSGSMFSGIDSKLATMLSSETIMNGEVGKGIEKGRESVWAMLDKLGYSKKPSTADKGKGRATEATEEAVDDPGYGEEDSIMMCTPLQPTTDLEPEIAESELEYVDDQEYSADTGDRSGPSTSAGASDSTTLNQKPPGESPPTKSPKSPPKAKRTFYPSSTKLSLEVTWWGYRLFLPPPIMAQLSNAHVAAAKRGAMVTAALKWIVDQVPIMMVPPQMRPALMMIKRMSPYLGYVGGFVAWSWGRVQSKDTGNGVVLTATWLLPIAILPAAWDFEVHGRPRDSVSAPSSEPIPAGPSSGVRTPKRSTSYGESTAQTDASASSPKRSRTMTSYPGGSGKSSRDNPKPL